MSRHYAYFLSSFLTWSLFCVGCNSEKPTDVTADSEWDAPDAKDSQDGKNVPTKVSKQEEFDGPPLELKLRTGNRFPLKKVVEQELRQASEKGDEISRSRLDLMMAITVGEQAGEKTRMTVNYDRVRYSHDVAGERVEFDSDNPPAQISEAVSAYAAMKGNGFSFWIGSDNRIVSVEGFKEFLEGCLRNVPEHHRANVMQFIEAGAGEGGISNFVDNSIGLLPYGNHTEVGEEWQREDHVGKPVPLHVRSKYTLKELTHDYAVVDIHGVIDPSTSVHALDRTQGGARVSVMGGTVTGACTLYRESGLPKESRVVRAMDMVVQLSSGPQFRQSKTIVTTIESYPSSNTANSRIRDKVQPVSGTFDSEQPPPRNQRR